MISSVSPSLKYSLSPLRLMSTKGSTTIEGAGVPAAACVRSSRVRPDKSTAAATTSGTAAAAAAPRENRRGRRAHRRQRGRVDTSALPIATPPTAGSSPSPSKSRSSAFADSYRVSRDFASARDTTRSSAAGTSARCVEGAAGSASRIAARRAGDSCAPNGRSVREHLVQHDAQRPDVGAGVYVGRREAARGSCTPACPAARLPRR